MIDLAVFAALTDGQEVHAGELVFADPDAHGRCASEFRYAAAWLAHPQRFALDPESLPLSLGRAVVRAENLRPPLAVFDDALPDRWGRSLLVAAHRLPLSEQHEPRLLQLIGDGALGALRFRSAAARSASAPAKISSLADLLEAAERFEQRQAITEPQLQRLLAAGSTPGGARPKALIEHAGAGWIAKFPSRVLDEGLDMVRLEAAGLELARRAGIDVPAFEVVAVGKRAVLLVQRFDLAPGGGRRHMLSFRTLCREWAGVRVLDYGTLATALRLHAAQPAAQAAEFFRRVVFNAAFGNTDDHLKNFWLLHGGGGWRLSPFFDLLPDTGRRRLHALAFDLHADPPDRATLLVLAGRWGAGNGAESIDRVVKAVAGFPAVAKRLGVPAADIAAFKGDIAARCRALRA
jgi:serine/threonine-protein kinase HipA